MAGGLIGRIWRFLSGCPSCVEGVQATPVTFRRAVALMYLPFLAIALGSCSSSESSSNPKSVTTTEVVRYSDASKAKALRLARNDPAVKEIVKGRGPVYGKPSGWARTNLEKLGYGIPIRLTDPASFISVDWPTIQNKDELYGEGWSEEGGGDNTNLEPGLLPEIGMEKTGARELRRIIVMVDLRQERVAEIHPMGGSVFRVPGP